MKNIRSLALGLPLALSVAAAANAQSVQSAQTDVYHVHFTKAVPGQAAALATVLKTPDAQAPMPDHFVVLRHQQGDDWDYCVIQHLGTKATVDAAPAPANPGRDMRAWHGDTFVSGPAWADFARAMGVAADSVGKTGGSVYSVAVWRAAPGHRDQLEKALKQADPASKVATGEVLLQHLEGAPWQYLAITRYDSWQDFATAQAATASSAGSGQDGWSEIRSHSTYHHDTLADRIAPR